MHLYAEELGGWNEFSDGSYHADGLDMKAGQILAIWTEVNFEVDELIPSDYSVVAWAEKEELYMWSEGDSTSEPFPNF